MQPLPAVTTRKFVTVDVERYTEMLNGSEMTDDEKREFVVALWTILVSLSDLGYGLREAR